jgi:ubiquitin carboxyl-terminal hydrolase 4/11
MKGLLSPAPSPPETVQENMSRKRTRSASDSSADTPSSPKRAASEVPSASSDIEINHAGYQRANSLVQLTNDLGIDQYMASQDEAEDPKSVVQNLSPQEKLTIIRKMKQKEMVEGETWFVVSHSWYKKWERACSGKVEKNEADESSIPAVDNSDIATVEGNISMTPAEGLNVDYVPEQAWEHLVQW